MTTPDRRSLSALEESTVILMDDRSSAARRRIQEKEEDGDPQVWEVLDKSFKEVQSVLDRNRALIQQVNDNHRSKIPDNMLKNVDLIREINGNITKVVSLYSGLSSDFNSACRRRSPKDGNSS